MERRLHLTWPLILVAAGILWILIEMGRVPVANLWVLTYLWPLFLVAAGLGLILRPYWRYAGTVLGALVVVAIFLAILFAGQLGWNRFPDYSLQGISLFSGTTERGSGHVITENRPVHGFTTIHLSYPATVTIRQGATEGLSIESDDNVVASIRTQVTGDVLEIDNSGILTVKNSILGDAATDPNCQNDVSLGGSIRAWAIPGCVETSPLSQTSKDLGPATEKAV